MKRVIFASTAVASMLVLGAPVALAQVPTGPDTVACSQALVVEGEAALVAVNAAKALDAASEIDLAAAVKVVTDAQAELTAARKITPRDLPAIATAQVKLQNALKALQNMVPDVDLTKQLQTAQYQLQLKIDARVAACKPSVAVTPSPTPSPTPSATPVVVPFSDCDAVRASGAAPIASTNPRFQSSLDADRDGVGCEEVEDTVSTTTDGGQVSVVPNDAPETGEGPAPMPAAHRFALAALLVNFAGIAALHSRRLVRR